MRVRHSERFRCLPAMLPKDIVVFIEEDEGRNSRIAFAAALAEAWQAYLIATFIVDRLDSHAGFAVGEGLTNMLKHHGMEVQATVEQTRKVFDDLRERQGIVGEWRVSENEVGEALMLHARHASLAIVGPPFRKRRVNTTLSLSEDVIFASGRPSLLLPIDWPADRIGRRIVVGWNASREATRAIADAMPFLINAEQVHLVVVPDAKVRGLYGADAGADIAQHLARYGVKVILHQCEGEDAGSVLLDRCDALDADMLVLGAMGRSRISEFVFGGVTRTVLAAADRPLLLSR